MKKLLSSTLLLVFVVAFTGCTGAVEDYTLQPISIEEAPQAVVNQMESTELERGRMIIHPNDYDVDSTYAVIIDEEAISVEEHKVENGILRVAIDSTQGNENVTDMEGYKVLVLETDLNVSVATIRDSDDVGYPGLLIQ